MRIRIVRKLSPDCISRLCEEGFDLRESAFDAGGCYDVGTTLGALLLAEGWAEPVADERPASRVPLDAMPAEAFDCPTPPNLKRAVIRQSPAVAADRARKTATRTIRTRR